jgi:hypothetical protein
MAKGETLMPRTRGEDRVNRASEALYRSKLGDKVGALIRSSNFTRQQSQNEVLSSAGVAIATDVTKVRTTAVLNYKIAGVSKTKAATDPFWTLTGPVLADGMTRKYLLLIDAGGAASVLASNDAKTIAGCVFNPDVIYKKGGALENKAIVGYVVVSTVGAVYTPGTTSLAAATVTDTYFDGLDASMVPPGIDAL